MTGPERRDESVSFSLKQLLDLEDERVGEEQRAAHEKQRAADEERAARARAVDDERERVRLREREELARIEAMQQATIEQARIEVEARTRAEESERERAHERELSRIRAEGQRGSRLGPIVGAFLGGAALALAVFLAFFFGSAKPAADRRIAELEGTASRERVRAAALDLRIAEQSARLAVLETDLREARARPEAPAATPPTTPRPPPRTGGAPSPKAPAGDDKPCLPRDPMCFHIP